MIVSGIYLDIRYSDNPLMVAVAVVQGIMGTFGCVVACAYLAGEEWALRLTQLLLALQAFLIAGVFYLVLGASVLLRSPAAILIFIPFVAFHTWLLFYHMSARVESYFTRRAVRVGSYFTSYHFWVPTTIVALAYAFPCITVIFKAAGTLLLRPNLMLR
jgi:hypothetical protein